MSNKRKADGLELHRGGTPNLHKRSRHRYTEDDAKLATIFENLSSNDPETRLQAVGSIVQKCCQMRTRVNGISIAQNGPETDLRKDVQHDQSEYILVRLIRGLCSSRKSARHGFYLALTEILRARGAFRQPREVMDLIVQNTTAEKGSSGQVSHPSRSVMESS